MSLTEYQEKIRGLLQNAFKSNTVSEWDTGMDVGVYSPCLDIAVGPFSIQNDVSLQAEYNQMFDANLHILRQLVLLHLINLNYITEEATQEQSSQIVTQKLNEIRHFNINSRCFIAIEIENEVSRKHLMGGALNASALGRIAVAVGSTNEKHRAFKRLYQYFKFLQNVDKPTFKTNNILVISKEQLHDILSNY